jgi:hydroxyacylglutathione hydrolase
MTMIVEQMIVGMMGVCCYVVGCPKTGKGVVVDPGGDEERVIDTINRLGLAVELIVNTHGHPDHVCGNRGIKEATGALIAMHGADVDFFGQPDISRFFSSLGLPTSPPVDRRLKTGEIIEVGSLSLKVLHTPGHSPGGICLYAAPHLFTGDTLFVGGVGRTDFPGGSTRQLLSSIRNELFALPDDTVVWPGHGYGGQKSTIGEEKIGNPFLQGGL